MLGAESHARSKITLAGTMKSVLITGASTGIGEACAIYLAARGWQVFAGVRKEADSVRLRTIANIRPVTLDVTKTQHIADVVKLIHEEAGPEGLQGLVNNAGIAVTGPLEFLPMTDFRRQMDVNFFGLVELTQACLPLLRAGQGRVVNISSIGGRIVAPFLTPYSASKFALEAFSDGLRRELRPWKIHVSSIQAGSIDTPIWEKSLKEAGVFRSKLPQEAEDLYSRGMDGTLKFSQKSAARGIRAEMVAQVVEHALMVPRPRARYAVGRGTRWVIALARVLPDEFLDWLMGRNLYR
jgi:NAD(P)-dependent dehydrogenase (short-subunit alcohol dehydrogenase family)